MPNFDPTQTRNVPGTVVAFICNWPASQGVTASAPTSIAISNFPVVQPVSFDQPVSVIGAFWQATQPVSITQSLWPATQAVSLAALPKAREDAVAMTWVGLKSAAPTANAVQADTGALAAGDYDFDIYLAAADTVAVGKGLVIEHRDAANTATLLTLAGCVANSNQYIALRRYTIATNQRIRVIAGTAAGAASSMYVSSIGRRIA